MRTMRTTSAFEYDTYWEYKIVRARHGEFARRDHLTDLLRQEARAGWIMTEKYSDGQVRFKRARSARAELRRERSDIKQRTAERT